MIYSTLLLNADAMPLNLLPLSVMPWEEAIKTLWVGTTEVINYYEDWFVHSPSVTMQVPAVVILKQQIQVKRNARLATSSGPSSTLLFLRDGYQCQYCEKIFPKGQLTIDHVLPKKYGGKSRWENCTSACTVCNGRRGHDVRIQPIRRPFRPTYSDLIKMMKKFPINIPHYSWNFFLGWDKNIVNLVDPRTDKVSMMTENFAMEDAVNLK